VPIDAVLLPASLSFNLAVEMTILGGTWVFPLGVHALEKERKFV
jgi:hypothetical protein